MSCVQTYKSKTKLLLAIAAVQLGAITMATRVPVFFIDAEDQLEKDTT